MRQQRELIKTKRSYNTKKYQEKEKAFCEGYKKTMSEKRAKALFKNKEETIKLMKSLPKSGKKQITSGALWCVLVPLPNEGIEIEWHAVTDGPTVTQLILERNKKHFSQAGETPLATNEIIDLIGPGADTEYAEKILDGTADLTEATDDETSQTLLSLMRRETTIKIDLTKEDMMNRYRKWKEKTTTSPSGRHLGHFHALFRPFSSDNDAEKEEIEDMRSTIICLHHTMLRIATDNSFVYDRWKTIVTQMIEKDKGSPKLYRLRVIHLYECDLNLLFGVCFRKLQQHNEDI